jgi:hypothetical protein
MHRAPACANVEAVEGRQVTRAAGAGRRRRAQCCGLLCCTDGRDLAADVKGNGVALKCDALALLLCHPIKDGLARGRGGLGRAALRLG